MIAFKQLCKDSGCTLTNTQFCKGAIIITVERMIIIMVIFLLLQQIAAKNIQEDKGELKGTLTSSEKPFFGYF